MKNAIIILLILTSVAFGAKQYQNVQTNFTAGELSPLLDGRTDLSRYFNGCRVLENMLVYPQGGAMRRPGSYYVAETKDSTEVSRVIPFEYSDLDAYVLEFGDETVRFYRDRGLIQSGSGVEKLAYDIAYVDTTAETFTLENEGDLSDFFAVGDIFVVLNSAGNDGLWTVKTATYSDPCFTITVINAQDITDSEPNGILSKALANWQLNENADNNTVASETELYNGTATTTTATIHEVGKVGEGCFDLRRQYAVEVDDTDNLTMLTAAVDRAFTIHAWAYVSPQNVEQTIISKWQGGTAREWSFGLDADQKLRFDLADEGAGLDANTVAQFKFNDNAASTAVEDTTGSHDANSTANTSTLHAYSKFGGGCFDFDGQYSVEIDDHGDFTFATGGVDEPFSISAWIYVTGSGTAEWIVGKWATQTDREYFFGLRDTGVLGLSLKDESANSRIARDSSSALDSGEWHFVVATYDGSEVHTGITLYDNGSELSTDNVSKGTYSGMEDGDCNVVISGYYESDQATLQKFYQDRIDNVMIFNSELSEWEQGLLYAQGEDIDAGGAYCLSDDALSYGWNFVAGVYDGTGGSTAADGITLYVNGAAVDSTAYNDADYVDMHNTATDVLIGARYNSAGGLTSIWQDKLDCVTLYRTEQSATYIAALYTTSTHEIASPYAAEDVFGIQYVQSADVMYLVHPDYPPYKLSRYGHDYWTLEEIGFLRGPFLEENITSTTITPSATTGSITLESSAPIFDANHVGALWQVTHTIESNRVSGTFSANGNSSSLTVQLGRKTDFFTHGTWTGTATLQVSYDSGTNWEDIYTAAIAADGNIELHHNEEIDDAIYRVTMTNYSSGKCKYNLVARTYNLDGVVEIVDFTDPCNVTADVNEELGDTTATKRWAEGAWSSHRGYPQAISFFEQRLMFAGTRYRPITIWGSKSGPGGDYENMLAGTLEDDAIIYTLSTAEQNPIQWLCDQNKLLVGTAGGEYTIGASSDDEALSPTNVSVRRHDSCGSQQIQPVRVNNVLLFLQRGARKLLELVYSWESDSFVTSEISILAEHITDSTIVDIAIQKRPNWTLWCVRDDGNMAAVTYERRHEVVGWHLHTTDGDYESVAVIPGAEEDEIWVVVKREIDGNDLRYIEYFKPWDWGDEQSDVFFVDSGLTYDGGDAVNISGITQADPAVVTVSTWPAQEDGTAMVDGDNIYIYNVVGMTEINYKVYTVNDVNVTGKTFALRDSTDAVDYNSVGFTAYTSGGTVQMVENSFATLAHLEGETVAVCANGGAHPDCTVSSSSVTLNEFYNKVHIGLPYNSNLQPMRLQPQAETKRIYKLVANFYETLGCQAGPDEDNLDRYEFSTSSDTMDEPPPLSSDPKEMLFEAPFGREGDIYIRQAQPLPLTLRAIIAKYIVGDVQ
jgi:hypothetical protein